MDVPFPLIRSSQCEPNGFAIFLADLPALKIGVWPPHGCYVLFRFLAYGEIMLFGQPDDSSHAEIPSPIDGLAAGDDGR